MNRRPITYNYLKTIANGSIHFHAFSYQYTGSGYQTVEKSNLLHGFVLPSGAVSGEFVGFFRADLLTL